MKTNQSQTAPAEVRENIMGTMEINPLLVKLSVPMMISMLVQALYNVVDSVFVSHVSESALTAVSLAFSLQNVMIAVGVGTGVGVNAFLSRSLGEKNYDAANRAAENGVFLAVLSTLVFTVAGLTLAHPFIAVQTDIPDIVSSGTAYMRICGGLSFGLFLEIMFERLLQATGRTFYTMLTQGTGAIINIIMDPVRIFGLGPVPAMGIAGAALATGIGQVLSVVVYLVVYLRTELPVRLRRSCLRPDAVLDGRLYAIGVPAILNLALPSLLVTFLNGLLAAFSQSYVVVLGIYYKLQTFLYLPANGFVQGMRPLIGYNYGAREHARVKKLFRLTLLMSAAIMAAGTVICQIASGQLIGLFTQNPETIAAGQTALRIISIGFVISAVSTTASGALEGLGKGAESLVIALCRYVVFIMPLAALLCNWLGADGAWHAFWLTEVLAAVVSGAVYRRAVTHKK